MTSEHLQVRGPPARAAVWGRFIGKTPFVRHDAGHERVDADVWVIALCDRYLSALLKEADRVYLNSVARVILQLKCDQPTVRESVRSGLADLWIVRPGKE